MRDDGGFAGTSVGSLVDSRSFLTGIDWTGVFGAVFGGIGVIRTGHSDNSFGE